MPSIEVLLAPPVPPGAVRGAHVAVFDVLRATTTIATALAYGATGVVPVSEPDDAIALGHRLGRDRVLFCGEREARRLEGFDLDNSPTSLTPDTVAGKTLVMTTTNGTRAFNAVTAGGAASIRSAALVNRAAIADALVTDDGEIVIVCSGESGAFALEDALGAGALVDALHTRRPDYALRDSARAAALLYRSVATRLADAVASADHAQNLARKGFTTDIAYCAELDTLTTVPTLRDGILVAAATAASRP